MLSVSVRGDDRVGRGLRTLAARLRDLTPAWRLIEADLVAAAAPLTPVDTAALVNSIRADARGDGLTVSAGAGLGVYPIVQNFGSAVRNIQGSRFLAGGPVEELAEQRGPDAVEELLTRTARMAGLT